MQGFVYYAGYIFIPVLFLLNLGSNLYRALKNVWNNTKIQTQSDIASHKRYYKRG